MVSSGLHRLAILTAAAAFVVILAGALVTSTGSGMAVPDWPQSFGQWMPPGWWKMPGGVLYEHGHRMLAGCAGLLVLALALWAAAVEPRRSVRWTAWAALIAVVVQAALGGLTVLLGTWHGWGRTSPLVSTLHAALAQALLCLLAGVAALTAPTWRREELEGSAWFGHAALLVVLAYAQVLLGAVTRQQHAGMVIPDFPLSYGKWVPEFSDWRVGVNYAHRVGGGLVLALALGLSWRILRAGASPALRLLARWLAAAVLIQVLLGALSIWTALRPWATVPHVAGGSLVLCLALLMALRLRGAGGGSAA